MSFNKKYDYLKLVLQSLLLLLISVCLSAPGFAQGSGSTQSDLSKDTPNDATHTGAFDVREDYRRANKLSIPFGPPTKRNPEGLDEVKDRESVGPDTVDHGPGPVYSWPVIITSATSAVPTKRDRGITKHRLQTFGYPISDTQYQMIHRMNQQVMLEEMFDPERIMWLGATMGATQVQDTSNSCANVIRNQCASAIDYVSCYIDNFTVQADNRWNKIRNQLFMMMAYLFLLPGAMLAQVKVIVNSGMPLGGNDTSPFEGIIRSIVAIFLIPATYLVVNYGIDLNNSITYEIYTNYERIFGSNMYKDAMCCVIRAFPIRQSHENRNGIYKEVVPWQDDVSDGTPASGLESRSLKVKVEDPCSGQFETDPDRADEQAPFLSVGQRLVVNGSNAVIAMTWNILCAFQVVFLMYLWLVGPVVAALWVYPHEALRNAFPSWVEGVITLCFWALFWNTVVLLMACFKGVDSTGSIITSALLFLATASVKSAFDFAGLVKDAGKTAGDAIGGQLGQMANRATPGVAGGGQGHGSRGGGAGAPKVHASGGRAGGSHGGSATTHGSVGTSHGGAHGAGTLGSLASGGSSSASLHVSGTVSSAGTHAGHAGGLSAGAYESMPGRIASGALGEHGARMGSSGDLSGSSAGSAVSSTLSGSGDSGGMGERGASGLDGMSLSSPPLIVPGSAPNEISLNNSLSSSAIYDSSSSFNSTSNFASFNSTDLSGVVNGAQGQYSAAAAAGLIGQDNLANFPREGSIISKEQAYQNFEKAMREVEARNAQSGAFTPESQQRNDLMQNWKDLLDSGEKNPESSGTLMSIPDSLPDTNAGGNWTTASPETAAIFNQGFGDAYSRVASVVDQANQSLSLPGGGGLNPQVADGLRTLANDMAQVAPNMGQMSPQAAGATLERWQQQADAMSQQMQQPAMAGQYSADQYARMQNDVQQAQMAMSQVQQYYYPSDSSYGTAYAPPQQTYGGGYSDSPYYPTQMPQQQTPDQTVYNSGTWTPASDSTIYSQGQQQMPDPNYYGGNVYPQQAPDPSYYSGGYYPTPQQAPDQYQQQAPPPDQQVYPVYQNNQQPDPNYGPIPGAYPNQPDAGAQWLANAPNDQNPWSNSTPLGYIPVQQQDPQHVDPQYREQYQQPDQQYQQQPDYGSASGGARPQPQQAPQQSINLPPVAPPHISNRPSGSSKPIEPGQQGPQQHQKESAKHAQDPLKYNANTGKYNYNDKKEMTEEEKRAMRRAMGLPEEEEE